MLMRTVLGGLVSLLLGWMSPAFAGAPPATHGSSIAHDRDGARWAIANGTVAWQVSGDPGTRDAALVSVRVGAAPAWPIATGADGLLQIDGRTREIGRLREGFTVESVSYFHVANGVQLDVAMRLTDVRIAVHATLRALRGFTCARALDDGPITRFPRPFALNTSFA
jgi:hypothetical protein